MTSRLKKLLIACHPDRHGGDHSRMEEYFRAAKRPAHGTFRCVDCATTVSRQGTRCGVCFQAKRRIKKVLPVAALLLLLCALCVSVANAQPVPPLPAKTATLANQIGSAPVLSTNTTHAITVPAPPVRPLGSVELTWNPSPDSSVTGYRVYQGGITGNYTNSYAIGNRTNATVAPLLEGVTYYFAVTAYDATGAESRPSNEVSFTAQIRGTIEIAAWRYKNPGIFGQANEIVESTDGMKTWHVIKEFVGNGTVQSVLVTNTSAASFRVRIKP
jgi:hypothetical protein